MTAFVRKEKAEILRHALSKLAKTTPITAIGPGSIARAITESITGEIGDLYSILDYNTSMTFLSTASGRALDLIGTLYNTERKRLTQLATIDESIGSFYFYIDEPHGEDITIPSGTRITTEAQDYVSSRFSYVTTQTVKIGAGRLRAYVSLRPEFQDSIFTAGANTLVVHNIVSPAGVTLKCTNPKPIAAQEGFESDDNYRLRIIKSIRASAGGTSESLRFTALGVSGVRDVKVRSGPYGLGTAEVLVVPEEVDEDGSLMTQVRQALNSVAATGVRLFVREPDYITFDLTATIFLRPDVQVEAMGTARRATIGVQRFINRLLPGQALVYSQLLQAILDSSDAIADVNIVRMRISGAEVLRRNYTPKGDQQIISGNIIVREAQT